MPEQATPSPGRRAQLRRTSIAPRDAPGERITGRRGDGEVRMNSGMYISPSLLSLPTSPPPCITGRQSLRCAREKSAPELRLSAGRRRDRCFQDTAPRNASGNSLSLTRSDAAIIWCPLGVTRYVHEPQYTIDEIEVEHEALGRLAHSLQPPRRPIRSHSERLSTAISLPATRSWWMLSNVVMAVPRCTGCEPAARPLLRRIYTPRARSAPPRSLNARSPRAA